jgi:uncharacterized protein (TIGR02679 family)
VSGGPEPDLERLNRVLGGPELEWLVERIRKRMAQNRPLDGVVTLAEATTRQRRAVEMILGRAPGAAKSLSVPLPELDAVLRDSGIHPGGLRGAVEALHGPVPDRKAAAARQTAAWASAREPVDDATRGHPHLALWWSQPGTQGSFRRWAGGNPEVGLALARQAAAVLTSLPSSGVTLPVFAAQTTGDAHALDDDRALGRMVFSALCAWVPAISAAPESPAELPRAQARRAVWNEFGVGLDELSSRVLVLGLPGSAQTSLGRMLAVGCRSGEPLVLTLRQLSRAANDGSDSFGVASRGVFVCENPAVLEAAAQRLGAACPPLICVEGQLSVAARVLLRSLREHGAHFRYHGDFDWGGIRIANTVISLTGARPWRYTQAAYLDAVDRDLGTPLTTGEPCDALWDADLRGAVEGRGIRVEEEHLLPELLAELAASAAAQAAPTAGPQ